MDKEQLIQNYLTLQLTQQEQDAFNHLMLTDAAFAKLVREEKALQAAIHLHNREQLKQQLLQLDNPRKVTMPLIKKYAYLIAAACVIVAIIGTVLLLQKPSSKELYAAYFKPYPNTIAPIVRDGTNNANTNLQQAMYLYEQENYFAAKQILDTLKVEEKKHEIILYKAVCLMQQQAYKQAYDILTNINEPNNQIQYATEWYRALCALQLKKISIAKNILQTLQKKENAYQLEARKLLEDL